MTPADGSTESTESFWDLLADVARLQREMGRDMVAWAYVYDAAGKALQLNADTTALMADVGRRGEQFIRSGPPAAARQAMQLFLNPMQALGATPGGSLADPFSRFWEAWRSAGADAGRPPSGTRLGGRERGARAAGGEKEQSE
jgi:hypothetical protein